MTVTPIHTTPTRAPFEFYDLDISWDVRQELDTRSPVFQWFGRVDVLEDEEDPEAPSGKLGSCKAHVLPRATSSGTTGDDLDSIDADTAMYMDLCHHSSGSLKSTLVRKYGEFVFDGLVILDRMYVDPSVRGRGMPRHIIASLLAAAPPAGLVACFPHPFTGFPGPVREDDEAEQDEAVVEKETKRLQRYWSTKHGFQPVPKTKLYVANPNRLILAGGREDES